MNEEERKAHPQARLIPSAIFRKYFRSKLTDAQIQLMQANDQILPSLLQPLNRVNLHEKVRVWLAIAFSHPAISDELLMDFAQQLAMLPQQIIVCSAALGRLSFFEKILSQYPEHLAYIKHQDPMQDALRCGYFDLVERILELAADDNERRAIFDTPVPLKDRFRDAVSRGYPLLVNLFINLFPSEDIQLLVQAHNYDLLRVASQQENLTIFNQLLEVPSIFYEVELNEKFDREIQPFIQSKLEALHTHYREPQAGNNEDIFDIKTPAELEIYFSILKHLIGNHGALEEIDFLAKIPSMKALLHTADNVLLVWAVNKGNESAIRLLLSNSEVGKLAIENNYYLQTEVMTFDVLPALLQVITPRGLNLESREMMEQPVDQILAVLQAISPKVTSLNLCQNSLNQMNINAINSSLITFPKITTLYLSQQEMESMTPRQRQAFIQIFPMLEAPIFIDENGNQLFDTLVKNINYANKTLGLNLGVPSLKKIGAFFAQENNVDTSSLPESAQEIPVKKL